MQPAADRKRVDAARWPRELTAGTGASSGVPGCPAISEACWGLETADALDFRRSTRLQAGMSSPPGSPEHPPLELLVELAAECRREVKARGQVLGWWLPSAAAVVVTLLWLLVGLGWPFIVVTLGMMWVFHRYQRYKLLQAFAAAPEFQLGVIGEPREVSRGHRQSHGLMFPVELKVTHRAQLVGGCVEVTSEGLPKSGERIGVCWIDGAIVECFEAGDVIGVVQLPGQGVTIASKGTDVYVAAALSLPEALQAQVVRVPRAR